MVKNISSATVESKETQGPQEEESVWKQPPYPPVPNGALFMAT